MWCFENKKIHHYVTLRWLKNIELNYDVLSISKMKNNHYSNDFLDKFITKSKEHLYVDGIISCPYVEENIIKDILILVPKKELLIAN